MSQTLLFNIPTPTQGQDPVYRLNWYESADGLLWGAKIDTILVSDLPTDTFGKYRWTSTVADPLKYHQIKTESLYGIESVTGFVIPPSNGVGSVPTDLFTERVNTGGDLYEIGDTVELLLDFEQEVADIIGDYINLLIVDQFDNTVAAVTGYKIGFSAYSAEWKIPKTLPRLYNIDNEVETDSAYYNLSDKWLLPGNTFVKYDFKVSKAIEDVVKDNSAFYIKVEGVGSDDGDLCEPVEIKFTTNLYPYHCSVSDVKTVLQGELDQVDNFTIAKDIVLNSETVDLHMRPAIIYHQAQYDLAVRMYVRYLTAKSHLNFLLNVKSETKEIDTLKYKREIGDSAKALENIEKLLNKYANIIWAGGKDTPFTTHTFSKGVYDPNRTQANRGSLDESDSYPWVNTTTSNSIVNVNGTAIELRGTRTVAFIRGKG